MVKKKVLFIFLFILSISFIGVILVVIINNKSPNIKSFEASEYQYFIDNFPSEDNLGSISDPNDLLKKVEAIWIKKFGKKIKNQKPYQIFYDKNNSIWLVQGTLRFNDFGGVANILVDNNTGNVLAVWHDK